MFDTSKMKFKIFSVRDFTFDGEEWNKDELIENILILKNDLKQLLAQQLEEDSLLKGCIAEIDHFEHYLSQMLYCIQYKSKPGTISDDDFSELKTVLTRYPEFEWVKSL